MAKHCISVFELPAPSIPAPAHLHMPVDAHRRDAAPFLTPPPTHAKLKAHTPDKAALQRAKAHVVHHVSYTMKGAVVSRVIHQAQHGHGVGPPAADEILDLGLHQIQGNGIVVGKRSSTAINLHDGAAEQGVEGALRLSGMKCGCLAEHALYLPAWQS